MSPNQEGSITLKSGKWLAHFYVYTKHPDTGCKIRRHESFVVESKSVITKKTARERLRDYLRNLLAPPVLPGDGPVAPSPVKGMTFKQFIEEVFIPVKKGVWRSATKRCSRYNIEVYLLRKFGNRPIASITYVELQIYFNELGEKYAEGTVVTILKLARTIFRLARKCHYINENPADECLTKPHTIVHPKKTITKEDLAKLIASIVDEMDQCLIAVGSMCALRTSEVFGLTWKSWQGGTLQITGTAWNGEMFEDQTKTVGSKKPIPIPTRILPYLEKWQSLCPDTSPDALMFPFMPTRGKNKGSIRPFIGYTFMSTRIFPIAYKLGIPRDLMNFRVFRRTAATHLQYFGTVKDVQSSLRQTNSSTALDIYIQPVEESIRRAINNRADDVFNSLPISQEQSPSVARIESDSIEPDPKANDSEGETET
jgi:integrase